MDKTTHEKETELGLKQARLKMLIFSSENLVSKEYQDALAWLLNYKDTIESKCDAGKQLETEYKEHLRIYNESLKKIEGTLSYVLEHAGQPGVMDIVDFQPNEWRDVKKEEALKSFVRCFYKSCWEVGNRLDLIPKQ